MIDLEKLESLAKAATPGPWVANNWGRVWYTPNPDSKQLVCDTLRNTVRNPKRWRDNARLIAAMREALPELIAENRALRERVRELERQRDWLIRYAWIDTNAPCPYEMGHFDQKKICPCWTPYHDWEKAEDMSRDDWHDLLMEGVMTEEDKVNCATDFCECLLVAAEQAAKEDGE